MHKKNQSAQYVGLYCIEKTVQLNKMQILFVLVTRTNVRITWLYNETY